MRLLTSRAMMHSRLATVLIRRRISMNPDAEALVSLRADNACRRGAFLLLAHGITGALTMRHFGHVMEAHIGHVMDSRMSWKHI